jgi:cysteinyl-tRNA synthetase
MDVKEPNIYILNALKDYILEVFTALGFTFGSTDDNSSKMNAVVDELVKTRDAIRAMGKNKEFTKKDLFKLTDEIRDVSGPKLGFTIEDRGNDPSIWYYS